MGIMGAIPTIEMMLEIGPQEIEQKVLRNTKYLMNELKLRDIKLYTDTDENHLSGIVSFFYNQAEALFEYLKKNQISVSLREGKIRVSPHFYNNTEDLNILLQTIDNFNRQ
jgi:cysteine desulfurase/selenocysteine lyase